MPLRRPAGSFKTPPEWINARYAARALSHGRPLEIAIYAVSVLYSPGPVNLLALKAGLRGPDWRVAEYCLGVGLAMFTCFALLGLAGSVLVRDRLMPWLAGVGAAYIAYPAWCLFRDDPRLETETGGRPDLHLGRGYLLQFLNPKGLMVILPVVTVMFPAAEIEGWEIPAIAALISLGAIGAPATYAAAGALIGRRVAAPWFVALFNKTMALLLASVAACIVYDFLIVGAGGQT